MSASETPSNKPMSPSLPSNEQNGTSGPACGDEMRLRRIHGLTPVLTYTRKPSGRREFTSAQGNTLAAFGWEPDRLVAERNFWRVGLHPDDAPVVEQALADLAQRGECSLEYRLRPCAGEYSWFLDTMALVKDAEGLPAEIVGYLLDISRTKRLELELREQLLAARAASQVKSEFLANMGHELTTPLNSVIGFSEVLQDGYYGELSEKQAEYVATIRESGLRLLSLLTDILQLAKLDAKDTALELDLASPAGLMRTSLGMAQEKALRHGIGLDMDAGPDMELETSLDEVKFRQVLLILLGNAVKRSPDGGKVRLTGHRVWQQGQEALLLGVEASGPGVSAAFAPQLFIPFARQEGQPPSAVQEEEGLGLALARSLARLQGGEVLLAQTSASGSRLEFRLPVRQTDHAPGHDPEQAAPKTVPPPKPGA